MVTGLSLHWAGDWERLECLEKLHLRVDGMFVLLPVRPPRRSAASR